MLEELIEERINWSYSKLVLNQKPDNLPDDTYKCDDKFYNKFEVAINRAKPFNIWSFE